MVRRQRWRRSPVSNVIPLAGRHLIEAGCNRHQSEMDSNAKR
jgi:hypothetical protein